MPEPAIEKRSVARGHARERVVFATIAGAVGLLVVAARPVAALASPTMRPISRIVYTKPLRSPGFAIRDRYVEGHAFESAIERRTDGLHSVVVRGPRYVVKNMPSTRHGATTLWSGDRSGQATSHVRQVFDAKTGQARVSYASLTPQRGSLVNRVRLLPAQAGRPTYQHGEHRLTPTRSQAEAASAELEQVIYDDHVANTRHVVVQRVSNGEVLHHREIGPREYIKLTEHGFR